eukprot:gene13021-3483_t
MAADGHAFNLRLSLVYWSVMVLFGMPLPSEELRNCKGGLRQCKLPRTLRLLVAGVEGRDAEGRVVERQALKALINRDTAMLFMKGAPDAPRCGGSRGCVIVGLLNEVEGVKYGYYDILGDEQVRKRRPVGVGELLGGLDIAEEMHAHGELKSELM